jgi:ATP-binding protein involved in chromosome partitioning
MVGDNPISIKAFEDFAGLAARNIAMRNANMPKTKIVEVVE